MRPEDRRSKEMLTKLFINFSAELALLQLNAGKRVVFEHPRRSSAWLLPRMRHLAERMHCVDLDMCCYGLRVWQGLLIKKSTRLLVSRQNMRTLCRQCPGDRHAGHRTHQVVEGSSPEVGSVSKFAGRYPVGFVKAVLRTARAELSRYEVCLVQAASDQECLVSARVLEMNLQAPEQLRASLHKLHVNLGHPSNSALVRVLKHGGASQSAIDLARNFRCELCESKQRPKPAHPAQEERVTEFNRRIGIDIKYLQGWRANQKIPAVNIVDDASSFQMMVPLSAPKENADLIRKTLLERWVSWAGTPSEIVVDPAQPNLSEALTVPQELNGSTKSSTAAEAHWQLGKVEVHGGWFSRVLDNVISECEPHDRQSWEECVSAAHSKNELI